MSEPPQLHQNPFGESPLTQRDQGLQPHVPFFAPNAIGVEWICRRAKQPKERRVEDQVRNTARRKSLNSVSKKCKKQIRGCFCLGFPTGFQRVISCRGLGFLPGVWAICAMCGFNYYRGLANCVFKARDVSLKAKPMQLAYGQASASGAAEYWLKIKIWVWGLVRAFGGL